MNLQVVLLSIILNKSISLTRKILLVLYYIILTWAYIYMKDPVWEEVDLKKIIVLNTACKTVLFHALSHVFVHYGQYNYFNEMGLHSQNVQKTISNVVMECASTNWPRVMDILTAGMGQTKPRDVVSGTFRDRLSITGRGCCKMGKSRVRNFLHPPSPLKTG